MQAQDNKKVDSLKNKALQGMLLRSHFIARSDSISKDIPNVIKEEKCLLRSNVPIVRLSGKNFEPMSVTEKLDSITLVDVS